MLILVNLIVGLSSGCYWTADAVIDYTFRTPSKAFALLALADSLGSGLGIWGGGKYCPSQSGTNTFPLGGLVLLMFLDLD